MQSKKYNLTSAFKLVNFEQPFMCVCVCVCYKLKMAGYSFKMVPKHPNGQQLSSVIIVIKHHTKTFSDRKFNYKCYKKH